MHVLLVEADDSSRQELCRGLTQAFYTVDPAPTLAAAAAKLALRDYDFVVLAPALPDGDGLALLRLAGPPSGHAPSFIVLTATAAVEDRLQAFALGADDSLAKPVACAELERRMQGIARRRYGANHQEICFGNGFLLSVMARTLRQGPQVVPLTCKVFDLLHYLLLHRGQVLSRQQLGAHLWGNARATIRKSNSIDAHIKNLRKLLAPFETAGVVETVRGIGYCIRPGAKGS